MATDPEEALAHGSPALTTLIIALGGTVAGRMLIGPSVVARLLRRDPSD